MRLRGCQSTNTSIRSEARCGRTRTKSMSGWSDSESGPRRHQPMSSSWLVLPVSVPSHIHRRPWGRLSWRAASPQFAAPPVARLPHPVALTLLPGMGFGAAFSPNGKQVAFFWTGPDREASEIDKASGIYMKTVGSESVRPLVLGWPGGDFVYGPTWSPDGRTIAFLRRTTIKETWLCLIASSGGSEKRLIRLHDKTGVFGADNRHWIGVSIAGESWRRSGWESASRPSTGLP